MSQIKSISLTAPTVGAVTSFYQSINLHIESVGAADLHIEDLAANFATLVEALLSVQNKQRAMTGTRTTQEADQARDAVVGFMQQYINAMAHSPVSAEAEAAGRLRLIMRSYPRIQDAEMERETTMMQGLIRDLGSATKDMTAIRASAYLEMLDDANSQFTTASAARSQEAQTRASIADGENSSALRRQAAQVYRQIVQVVNAFAIAVPGEKLEQFIGLVNGEILSLEKVIATEQGANTRHRNAADAAAQADEKSTTN